MKILAIVACLLAITLTVMEVTEAIDCNELCLKSGVPHIRGCFCRSQILSGKRNSERAETKEYNCSELCRLSSVNRIGPCYCRPDIVQQKKSDSSEYNDGNRDYIIKELLKDYFMQNEESEEK
ncbi:uncharacterized protein LOC129976447 isoform X2 [Argiope bruennichi]|uniref:uncharacterized protein LOC129976447 isoform X2 n=1 Tax=Argiope bruennichi TaxID=94029 RepID=UPI0024947D07|nr:uncharacterized protein LOC129976447 isoform X2 [Argiope bruennichi]